MFNNENLKKKNYYYQETKNMFSHERSMAKKHLYYAQLRLKFLEWLERGYMDEQNYSFETIKTDFNNMEECVAWQEAVLMFGDEVRDDGFYVDIIGNQNNYTIHLGYGKPRTNEEKLETRKIINELKEDMKNEKLPFQEKKKLDNFFHSLMNMKPKEEVLFHPRYDEFKAMVKLVATKGDDYQKVVAKLSKNKTNGKSLLENFLNKKN